MVYAEKFSLAMARIQVIEVSDKKITFGPLSYPIWCVEVAHADLGSLLVELKTLDGVERATWQETLTGYVVTSSLDEEYNIQETVERIQRTALGWANKHNITITH